MRFNEINWENSLNYVEEIFGWVKDPDVKEALQYFSFFQGDVTVCRQMRYFARMIDSQADIIFAIETDDGNFLGTCGLHDIDRVNDNVRIGIIIFNKNYWRQGFGKEALGLLLRLAFGEMKMNKVYLTVRADNALAINIYRKLGFREEGLMREQYKVKDGLYIDLSRMSILKSEWF